MAVQAAVNRKAESSSLSPGATASWLRIQAPGCKPGPRRWESSRRLHRSACGSGAIGSASPSRGEGCEFEPRLPLAASSGRSSFGRASPCQGEGSGFEPRRSLEPSRYAETEHVDVAQRQSSWLPPRRCGVSSRRRLHSGVVQSAERRALDPDLGGSSPPSRTKCQHHAPVV